MFINKDTWKRQFLTFPGNGCKKKKNVSSITRKTLQPQKAHILRKRAQKFKNILTYIS